MSKTLSIPAVVVRESAFRAEDIRAFVEDWLVPRLLRHLAEARTQSCNPVPNGDIAKPIPSMHIHDLESELPRTCGMEDAK